MEVMDYQALMEYLKINKRKARALLRTEGFPSFKLGQEYRTTREAVDEWIRTNPIIRLDYSKC
jgi:excisionase family DNA binding protein